MFFLHRGFVLRFLKLPCKNFQPNYHYLKILPKASHLKFISMETLNCFCVKKLKQLKFFLKNLPRTFLPSVAETFIHMLLYLCC